MYYVVRVLPGVSITVVPYFPIAVIYFYLLGFQGEFTTLRIGIITFNN